jgi:hypothetical protein
MISISRIRFQMPLETTIRAAVAAAGLLLAAPTAQAATLMVCRDLDMAAPPTKPLVVPEGSLFRDNGRTDDPMAAFGNDRWQLRLVTAAAVVIPPFQACARVPVRVTGDSSVKSVSVSDSRGLIYLGSDSLLDRPDESEELLSVKGRVLDQVP